MKKLWQASQILGSKSPFDLLDHTQAELDFILEKYADENPKAARFTRLGKTQPLSRAELDAAWDKVLVGRAHREMMGARMPSEAVMAVLRRREALSKPQIVKGPAAAGPPPKRP